MDRKVIDKTENLSSVANRKARKFGIEKSSNRIPQNSNSIIHDCRFKLKNLSLKVQVRYSVDIMEVARNFTMDNATAVHPRKVLLFIYNGTTNKRKAYKQSMYTFPV